MKKIFITGMSGTGKSTLAKEFEKQGIPVVDIDEMEECCDWQNNETHEKAQYLQGAGKEWLYSHTWICDLDKIKNAVLAYKEAEMVVTVGIIGNQKELLNFFDKTFLLQLDNETQKHRLLTRTTNDFANNESDQEYIFETKDEFEQDMISRGAIPLDATLPPAELADEIIDKS